VEVGTQKIMKKGDIL